MYQYSALPAVLRFGIAVIVFIFASCTGPSAHKRQQDKLLAQLDSQQVVVTEFIQGQTSQVLADIQEKLYDPATAEKMKIWQPKALQIQQYTKAVSAYVKKTRMLLGEKKAYQLFIKNDGGKNLFHQLIQYKKDVLKIDAGVAAEFGNIILKGIDTTDECIKRNIKNLSSTAALIYLHKLEQELAFTENRVITYCNNQVGTGCNLGMVTTSVLVAQNSNVLTLGDELIITAGVGEYSQKANSKITINGIPVKTENAVAVYKTKIYQQPGKYSLPVVIKYLEANGMEMVQQVTVDYTVK